ncbi:hypothetical protein N0V94_008003 [Neodidymelliopsis sp. IMI 364377]|nr:hypothetical protein N0V94_008003 [Neodidymelliopsis sp. IMI 364377]
MPPRLNISALSRSIAFRPKPQIQWPARSALRVAPSQCRTYADAPPYADQNAAPAQDRSHKPSSEPIEHVSEEAAKTAQIMGEQGPDVNQGTPVEDILKGDKEAQQHLPKVMQDALKQGNKTPAPKGSRSYSTMTTRSSEGMDMGLVDFEAASKLPVTPGLKFEMPTLPLPKDGHVKHRYDPVVEQVTNLLMQHGKKSVAQRQMAVVLQHLRTSPIPTINPARPLLPGAPPPSHLPLNPILYLTLAIDSVAPLLRIRAQKGAAGGGVALQIPVPLNQRQRRRTAIQWILSAALKRRNLGSGKNSLGQRVAQEMISVIEGKSGIWDRRNAVHKLGVAARSNIVLPRRR